MASAAMDLFLSKLDECDEKLGNPRREWTSRVTCMKQLEAAASELPSDSTVPAKAVQKIVFMVDAFRVELTDCRPAVVKQTCSLLGTLAWTCGASFTSITDALLVPILLMATKKKQTQVIAMAARQCLHCMTKASRFAIVILEKTYQHAKQDESLRMMCTSLVVLVLRYWDADSVLSRDAYTPLRRFIVKALGDGHTAVRSQARMALCLLCEYGRENFPELLDTVDMETMALIETEFPESLLATEQRRLQQRRILLVEPDQDDASLLSAIPEAHEDEADEDETSDDSSEDLSHVLILPRTYWHTPPPTAVGSQAACTSHKHACPSNNDTSPTEPWVDRLDWSQYSDTSSTKDEYVRERAASMEKMPSDRDHEGSSTIEDFEEESADERDAVPADDNDQGLAMSDDEWNGSDMAVLDEETRLGDATCGADRLEAVVSMQEWLQQNHDDDEIKLTPPAQTSGSTTTSHTDSHDGSPCTDEPIGAAQDVPGNVEDALDAAAMEGRAVDAPSKQDSLDVSNQNANDVQIAGHHERDLLSVHVIKSREESAMVSHEASAGTTPEPATPPTSQHDPLLARSAELAPPLPPLLQIRPSRRRHSSALPGGHDHQSGRPTPPRSPTPPPHAPPASGYRSIRYATASFAPSPSPPRSRLQTDAPSTAAMEPSVAFHANPDITRTQPTQGGRQDGGREAAVSSPRRNSLPAPLGTPPPARDAPSRPSKRRPKPPISAAQVHSLESTLDSILYSMDKLSSQLTPMKHLKDHVGQSLVPTTSLVGRPQAHTIVAPPADSLPLPKLFGAPSVHVPLDVRSEKATASSTAELSPHRLEVAPVSPPLKSRAPSSWDNAWDALLSLVWVASLVFAVVGVATAMKAHNNRTFLGFYSPDLATKAQLVAEFNDAADKTTQHLARLELAVHDWTAATHGAKRQLEQEVWVVDASTATEWEAVLSALRRQVAAELEAIACRTP